MSFLPCLLPEIASSKFHSGVLPFQKLDPSAKILQKKLFDVEGFQNMNDQQCIHGVQDVLIQHGECMSLIVNASQYRFCYRSCNWTPFRTLRTCVWCWKERWLDVPSSLTRSPRSASTSQNEVTQAAGAPATEGRFCSWGRQMWQQDAACIGGLQV